MDGHTCPNLDFNVKKTDRYETIARWDCFFAKGVFCDLYFCDSVSNNLVSLFFVSIKLPRGYQGKLVRQQIQVKIQS